MIIVMNVLEVNHLSLVVVLILSSTILIKSGENIIIEAKETVCTSIGYNLSLYPSDKTK